MEQGKIGRNANEEIQESGGSSNASRMPAQASNPRVEARTNQEGDEGAFVCDIGTCTASFGTKIGLGQHKRWAHPKEANDGIRTDRAKKVWSDEEVRMMAMDEAIAMLDTTNEVRFMNVHLHQMSGRNNVRTIDAIKGQRKKQVYKDLVVQYLNELKSQEGNRSNINEEQPHTRDGSDLPEIEATYVEEYRFSPVRLGIMNEGNENTNIADGTERTGANPRFEDTNTASHDGESITSFEGQVRLSTAVELENHEVNPTYAAVVDGTGLNIARNVRAGITDTYNEYENVSNNDEEQIIRTINECIKSLERKNSNRYKSLILVAKGIINKEENMSLSGWIRRWLSAGPKPRGDASRNKPKREMNAKGREKLEYTLTQRLYKRDFRTACRNILSGKSFKDGRSEYLVPIDTVEDYWKSIFETQSDRVEDKEITWCKNERLSGIWLPITELEVTSSELDLDTAAGPDRVKSSTWRTVDNAARTLIFNLLLLKNDLEQEMKMARTVLIPKVDEPTSPGDFRPLSITSVVVRHFHKILAKRIRCSHKFDERQRAFIDCDGTMENLSLLSAILTDARRKRKELHLASLDLRKAFDSVPHREIINTITELGFPKPYISYVSNLYCEAKTTLEYNRSKVDVRIKQGVLQGDPMSPLLFNTIMDRAIKCAPSEVGYTLFDKIINCMCYADDIILIASSKMGLQRTLNNVCKKFNELGLQINSDKSHTLSLVPSGRDKKIKVVGEPSFKIDNNWLEAIGILDVWKYLGVRFVGSKLEGARVSLSKELELITRAKLKPQQRVQVLTMALLPKHLHALVLGRVAITKLRDLDNEIRKYIRKWLKMPTDVPLAYLYNDVKSGGLGIPKLDQLIPLLRKSRLEKLESRWGDGVVHLTGSIFYKEQMEWCVKALRHIGNELNKQSRIKFWENQMKTKIDVQDLVDMKNCKSSNSWVNTKSDEVTGRDYVHFHQIRTNTLPSKARTARGRDTDRRCRAGCLASETNYHVIQQCFRTHGGRVLRHDKIVDMFKEHLVRKDGFSIIKEPHFRTEEGLRKPDLLITKDNKTVVLDVQVVGGGANRRDHDAKRAKYRSVKGLENLIKLRCRSREVEYEAFTITYKGAIEGRSVKLLDKLEIPEHLRFLMVISVLRGAWLNWSRFNASTMTRGRR